MSLIIVECSVVQKNLLLNIKGFDDFCANRDRRLCRDIFAMTLAEAI